MPIITVPKVLREKLGEDGAEALAEFINQPDGQIKSDAFNIFRERLGEDGAEALVEFINQALGR